MNTKQIEHNIEYNHDDLIRNAKTEDQKILAHILKEAQMNQMHLRAINKGLFWMIALIALIAAMAIRNSN